MITMATIRRTPARTPNTIASVRDTSVKQKKTNLKKLKTVFSTEGNFPGLLSTTKIKFSMVYTSVAVIT